jgi:hypothetical protein
MDKLPTLWLLKEQIYGNKTSVVIRNLGGRRNEQVKHRGFLEQTNCFIYHNGWYILHLPKSIECPTPR